MRALRERPMSQKLRAVMYTIDMTWFRMKPETQAKWMNRLRTECEATIVRIDELMSQLTELPITYADEDKING